MFKPSDLVTFSEELQQFIIEPNFMNVFLWQSILCSTHSSQKQSWAVEITGTKTAMIMAVPSIKVMYTS